MRSVFSAMALFDAHVGCTQSRSYQERSIQTDDTGTLRQRAGLDSIISARPAAGFCTFTSDDHPKDPSRCRHGPLAFDWDRSLLETWPSVIPARVWAHPALFGSWLTNPSTYEINRIKHEPFRGTEFKFWVQPNFSQKTYSWCCNIISVRSAGRVLSSWLMSELLRTWEVD
jgi:hypothetical protein